MVTKTSARAGRSVGVYPHVSFNITSAATLLMGVVFLFGPVASVFAEEDTYHTPPYLIQYRQNTAHIGTDPNTGAAVYNLPLVTPPGRNGVQPVLDLSYNSNNTDNSSTFGYGWDVSVPSIKRLNKEGTNNLYNENDYTSSLDGELVFVSENSGVETYRARFDNGNFNTYTLDTNVWAVTTKDGTSYKFGATTGSRQDDPNDSSHVYQWMLNEMRDTNDNYVSYEYYKDDGQIYPYKIKYTGHGSTDGIFEVEFLRESRSDTLTTYQPAFGVTSNYRIYEIQIKENGSWVRKYELDYTTGDNGNRSLLSSIIESGKAADTTVTTLPATTFTYQTSSVSWTQTSWNIPIYFIDNDEYYPERGVRYADVNGDGLVDILRAHATGGACSGSTALNTGSDWETGGPTISDPACFQVEGSATMNDWGLRTGDINGDGLVDLFLGRDTDHLNDTSTEDKTYKKIYLSNGSNFTSSSVYSIEDGFYFASSYYGSNNNTLLDLNNDGRVDIFDGGNAWYNGANETLGWTEFDAINGGSTIYELSPFFGDLNGDGLTDLVESITQQAYPNDTTDYRTYANTGFGFADMSWTVPFVFTAYGNDKGARFADINGDGLTDIVRAVKDANNNDDGSHQTIFINTGTGWGTTASLPNDVYFTQFTSNGYKDYGWRVMDINGDGLADLVGTYFDGSGLTPKVYINSGNKPDILSSVTTQEGGTVDFTYKTSYDYVDGSGNLLNTDAPFPVTVVDTMTRDDGFGNEDTHTYAYEGVDYYFNGYNDRAFTGFHIVTDTDNDANVTKTYYHQGNDTDSTNGEYSDDISKNGKAYRTAVYDSSNNLMLLTLNKWESTSLGNGAYLVANTRTTEMSYDGDTSHKDKSTTRSYSSSTGNLTSAVEWGEVSASTDGSFTDAGTDKRTTTITYATDSNGIIKNKPQEEIKTNYSNSTVQKVRHYYDSQSLGSVTTGNETKTEELISGSTYAVTDRTYNNYGLVTNINNPRGYDTALTYDTYNLYPATRTNHLNQATTRTYDYSSGKELAVTDPNGYVTEYTYDGLDRPLTLKGSDPASPSTLITLTSYDYTDTAGAVATHERTYHTGSVYSDSYTYSNGFGKPIQTRTSAEDATYAVIDTTYTRDGLTKTVSLPYFSAGTARTTATTKQNLITTYSYDAINRVLSMLNALGTTAYTYDDWTKTVTDTEDNDKDYNYDAFDDLVSVAEHNGVSAYTTAYQYDVNSNLTKITDSAGNIRNFTYDDLGNRLTAEDLHTSADGTFGTWVYTYDANGNKTSQIDPKSQTTNYTYDALDRILTEDYTGNAGTEVSYTYDTGMYGKGHLTSVTRGAVVTADTYEITGDIDTETKTIDSTNYVTSYDYTRQHQPALITYPDASQARYTYNVLGKVDKVEAKEDGGSFADVVSDIDYEPHGKVTYKDFGNDVVSYYTYDPEKLYELVNITTIDPDDSVSEDTEESQVVDETISQADAQDSVTSTGEVVLNENNAPEVTTEEVVAPDVGVRDDTDNALVLTEDTTETKPSVIEETTFNNEDTNVQEDSIVEQVASTEVVDVSEVVPLPTVSTDVTVGDEYEPINTVVTGSGKEAKGKRTANSYTLDEGLNADGQQVYTVRTFSAPIHYQTKNGSWQPIDARFRDSGTEFKVTKAPYTLEVPKEADQDFAKFSVGDVWLQLGLLDKKNIKQKVNKDWETNRTTKFNNLVDDNIDITLHAENDYVAKDVIVKNKQALKKLVQNGEYYELPFSASIPAGTEINVNGTILADTPIETSGKVLLTKDSSTIYIYPAVITDAEGNRTRIRVRYTKTDSGFTLAKLLPVDWLETAVYPVTTDAVVSYYAGAGDGASRTNHNYHETWDDAHDATSGDETDYGETSTNYAAASFNDGNKFKMARAFYPFDTSGLDDGAVITGATLSLYVSNTRIQDNDGNDFAVVVSTTQASTSSLSNSDYDEIGTTEGSTRLDISSDIGGAGRFEWDLNSTGLSWIDKTGWTKLGIREGHDLLDDPLANYNENRMGSYFSERSGTYYDPYLEITYYVPPTNAAPLAPSDLQTENYTDPPAVEDQTPEFSAIFNDDDTGDAGKYYEIQVITDGGNFSTPLWDSGKTLLGTEIDSGVRSEQISYGGTPLAQDGTTYYWRIKFWDLADAQGTWSDGTDTFSMTSSTIGQFAPSSLYANCIDASSGSTNPTDLKCGTPVFSAVHDAQAGGSATKYRLQVATSNNFATGVVWDSGASGTVLTAIPAGSRSNDIVYRGSPLAFDGTTYYWRIKFWNDGSVEGGWSTAATFATYTSEAFQNTTFTYDTVGNITSIVDGSDTNNAKDVAYTYDDLYRLTSATSDNAVYGSDYSLTYTYDSIGNLTNKSDVGNYTYTDSGYSNPHAATSVNGQTYAYDNNGNLTSDSTRTYSWNYDNTINNIVKDSTTHSYTYDHIGQRVSANDGTTTTVYPNRYYNTDGTNSTKYIYANNDLVAQIKDNGTTVTTYYIHPDHLGSTQALTNSSNLEAQTIDYYPYGGIRNNTQTDSVDELKKFTGHIYDTDNNLHYANARYYSQDVGKFTSQDPAYLNLGTEQRSSVILNDPQLANSYGYGRNNPLTYKDPNGQLAQLIGAIALGIFMPEVAGDNTINGTDPVSQAVNALNVGTFFVGGGTKAVASKVDDATSLIARNQAKGALGERVAGITKNTQKIPSTTKPGTSRIPDIFDHEAKIIGDVKNVNYQSFTSQLKDFAQYSQQNSYRFILQIDQRTQLSQTLQQLGQKIEVIRKDLNKLAK